MPHTGGTTETGGLWVKAAGEKMAGGTTRGARPRLAAVRRVSDEKAYLYQIIQTIGSGPDLEAILHGIVGLVTEATACHACFIYFVQGDRLVLRACSSMYAHLEGTVTMAIGEGLGGWVAKTRRSAFIREKALDDPRVRYFPELEEERFQSLVSVPMLSRDGDVIGVINLHAEAPHEFARADLDLLEHTASLVAGAVENARLYEDATTKVGLLTDLSRLAHRIASAANDEELLSMVAHDCRDLLKAERCEIYLLDADERLTRRGASPDRPGRASFDARRLWLEALMIDPQRPGSEEARALAEALWGKDLHGTPLVAPLVVGDERLGLVCALTQAPAADAQNALAAVASHTAVALKQLQVIDWLKEKNLVKDFFEALSRGQGDPEAVRSQAARLGCDLDAPHVVLHAGPWVARAAPAKRRGRRPAGRKQDASGWRDLSARVEASLASALPGTVFDRRETSIRALVRVPPDAEGGPVDAVRRVHATVAAGEGMPMAIGLSNVCRGAAAYRQGFEEALSAAEVGPLIRGGPGVFTYEDLGVYRYVLTSEEGIRDRFHERLERLSEYDRRRGTQLLESLEGYLDGRGNIVGTSRALYIHPNTLRQRLARIERVAGLDLEHDDWLSMAIAIKVVKLRRMRRSSKEEGGETDG